MHAYYKQNTPLFLAYLGLYTTSILYHFGKFNYPVHLRLNSVYGKVDVASCTILYLTALYDFFNRGTIQPPYSYICVAFHIFCPLFFVIPSKYGIMMWDPDIRVSETWHSIFHIMCLTTYIFIAHNK